MPKLHGSSFNDKLSKDDEELSRMLDDSLNDFGKSNFEPSSGEDAAHNVIDVEESDPSDSVNAKKAASEFQIMMKQLCEVHKVINHTSDQKANHSANFSRSTVCTSPDHDYSTTSSILDISSLSGDQPTDEDSQFAHTFLESMKYLTEQAKRVQEARTDREFVEAMKDLGEKESAEFLPFMQGLLGSLLSKEMLYAPLKDICDKYPGWLDKNRSILPKDVLDKYEKQSKLMQEVCSEFENEDDKEAEEDKSQRFERIVEKMHYIQNYGQPPGDLIGELPAGWSLDNESGLPIAENLDQAAEACKVM